MVMAMLSKWEPDINLFMVFVTSEMKSSPSTPDGTLKRFFLHLVTLEYTTFTVSAISFPLSTPHTALSIDARETSGGGRVMSADDCSKVEGSLSDV